ncbi:MAG: TonB-dependent receptor [Rhodothermaceae bacterium]|nr:TonB-dependent receptor [Rhodothermaceae bacterium]MYC04414.1 TonB-dependent receptor [Rhodothermaceae bacterium]MYI16699.1 TonB-dependent receptor [Rhodothermaceae bacterium]
MKNLYYFVVGVLMVMVGVLPVKAQESGSIQGTVYVTEDATVVTDATVMLVGLNYSQRVDGSGRFVFEEVPAGSVLLRVESPLWGRNSERVTVVAGETTEVDIEVLLHIHLEEMIITAGPTALTRSELVNPVNVLTDSDLLESDGVSLGESLKNFPGMASTYFGPGASRPIIGGVGGSRVKVLQHGLAIGDASDQSEDHAVSADAFDAKRIEIIRGPATLLYGSDITGGVVNILDGRVPNERPVNRIEGMVMGRGGLGSNERGGGGSLTGAFGNMVWRAHGLLRETGDVSTPSFNPEGDHEEHDHDDEEHGDEEHGDHDDEEHDDHDEDHDEDHGDEEHEMVDHIENSSTSLGRGSFGMSWLGRRGYIGAAVSFHNSDYGVPGHAHGAHEDEHEEEHEEDEHHDEDHLDEEEHDEHEDEHGHEEEGEGEVSIDLNSVTYDIEGAYRFGNGAIEGLRFRFGVSDYKHTELEHLESGAEEVGVVYENNQWEGRVELDHSLHRSTKGTAGVQMKRRDLATPTGSHSSLPATLSTQLGIFAMERINLGSLRLELSGRMQWQSHDPDGKASRSFSSLSLGGGANYEVSDQLSLSLSLARAAKAPSTTELYSDGLHTAIRSVEIGNENLEVEVTNNVTFSGFLNTEPVHVTLTGYLNQSDNFIYHAPTGMMEEGNPVLQTAQAEARITGLEVDADIEVFHSGNTHVILGLMGDYVDGQLTSRDDHLPRIPPLRLGASLQYSVNNFVANLSVRRIASQERVFSTEEHTDGYTMIDAKVRYRLITGSMAQSISLQGLNLGNTLARAHTSFLKETVPLPGRDIRLTYAIHF